MQVDLKFKIKAGDGQITFPIYRVPVSGGTEPVDAGDIQNLQVDLDRQVLQSSQEGVMVTAAYSNVAEGAHQIVITGALNNVAFAIVYAVQAEELGVPAEVVAPNAYVSLAPTGEGTIEQQIKDLQDRMGTAEGEIVAITAALPDLATKEEVQETLGEILAAIQALPDGQAVSAQVALNTAAIEGLQEDVSQLGQDISEKVVLLKGFGKQWQDVSTTTWQVGEIMYNTNTNVLRKAATVTESGGVSSWATPNPELHKDSIYICKNELYIWNELEMIRVDVDLISRINQTNTQVSNNLKSVEDAFSTLSRQLIINGLQELSSEVGALKADGTIASEFTTLTTKKYNIENEPLLFVNGRQPDNENYVLAAIYNSENELLSIFRGKTIGQILNFPIITSGAKYIKVSSVESSTPIAVNVISNKDLSLITEIPDLIKTIEEMANGHEGEDLTYTQYVNAYIKADGSLQETETYWKLYKYDVSAERVVFVTGRAASMSAVAAFYDANDNPISVINYGTSTNYVDLCLYVPYDAKYLRVNQHEGYPSAKKFSVWGKYKRNDLKGKTVAFIGDSLTAGGTETAPLDKLYHKIFADKYECINRNLGVWGTCIANNTKNTDKVANRFVTRATAQNLSDCSLIVVFGGTNDFTYDSKPIGDCLVEVSQTPSSEYMGNKKLVAPSDTDTFAGAVHELINTIRAVAPTVPILFMTPLKKHYGANSSIQVNAEGNYLQDFVDAIKTICGFYSIPVFDCNGMSQLDFMNTAISNLYSNDGLHPNIAGHKLLGELLFRFVEDNVYIG